VAQHALSGRAGWYVIGILTTLFFFPASVIYCGVALYQMRDAAADYPGIARTRVSLACFGGVALLMLLAALF
jgi:hypothetical protein